MRTTLSISLLAIALAAGGCKKKQDDTGAAATQVKKTAENVDDQAKDLNKTQTDKDSKPKDLDKAQGDLAAAKTDLVAAKEKYSVTVKDRLAKIDIRIHELEQRTDAKSKQAAIDLKARRDQLSTRLGTMQDRAAADWDAFTKDVDNSFDKLESDVNDALK
jgi:predicted  nucleic acid-binding Zn-ribbon protein